LPLELGEQPGRLLPTGGHIETDPQNAGDGVADIPGRFGGPFQDPQRLSSTLQEDNPSRSEAHTSRRSLQEFDTEHSFQLPHLGAEDLLGHMNSACRGGKASLLSYSDEVAKVPQLDIHRHGSVPEGGA
jgi:hypothetical protein